MQGFLVEPTRRRGAVTGVLGYRNGFLTSMAANQNDTDNITSDDIAAFVLGDAEPQTVRRVAAAALQFASVRERVAQARRLADAASSNVVAATTEEETADFARQAERLRERLMKASLTALGADEIAEAPVVTPRSVVSGAVAALARLARNRGGVLYQAGVSAAREFTDAIGGAARSQTLLTGRHALTLPCLAPATASFATADAVAHVQRQTVTTGDGVRIEFQQLPGAEPPRLRVFVDASGLSGDAANRAYNVAYLTVEESGGAAPDRHIFVVALNNEGRGFTEVTVGGALTVDAALPAPRGACHLIGATLARWSPEFGEATAQDEQGSDNNDGNVAPRSF